MTHATPFKLEELAREAGVAARTVRYYVQRGLLPAPDFRGRDTTYGKDHLVRLRAIRALQQAGLSLDQIQARLAAARPGDIERIARGEGAAVRDAEPPPPDATLPAPAGSSPYRRPAFHPAVERWERIVLAPGVELHVRDGAPPYAMRLAREIEAQYERERRAGE